MRQHDYASAVYHGWQWRQTREAYKRYRQGLCERCMSKGLIVPGVEVHHRIKLTADNVNDPNICYSFDNLELLCEECHENEHRHGHKRYAFGEDGRLMLDTVPPRSD